jgi:hypothetical protein
MRFAAETPVKVLREYLDYDPETGVMRWRKRISSRGMPGGIVGCPKGPGDYLVFQIRGILYRLHRVAWAHYYGAWPTDEIDHRDLDRQNNRIKNLRLAERTTNAANGPGHLPGRLKGTGTMPNGRFTAQIGVSRKKLHLGCFDTEQEAHEAYCRAAVQHFGEFARAE